MYELKKNGKVFTSKYVVTGPSSYEKRIYRAAVSHRLRNTALDHWNRPQSYLVHHIFVHTARLNTVRWKLYSGRCVKNTAPPSALLFKF